MKYIKETIKNIMYIMRIYKIILALYDYSCDLKNRKLSEKYPNVKFYGKCVINDLNKFSIGEYSNLKDAYIDSSGGVQIGRNVASGINLTIFSHNHDYENSEIIPCGYGGEIDNIYKKVIINDFVWIGANVSILPGVCLGKGSIIGMGSVVTKDVPEFAVVGGNPAKVLKYRNVEAFVEKEKKGKYWGSNLID